MLGAEVVCVHVGVDLVVLGFQRAFPVGAIRTRLAARKVVVWRGRSHVIDKAP